MSTCLDYSQLNPALCLSRELVYKDYLNQLDCAPINWGYGPISTEGISFLKVSSVTCPTSNDTSPFESTLYALWSLDITLCYILKVSPLSTTAYLGVSHRHNHTLALELLRQGLTLTYPSIGLEMIEDQALCQLLIQDIFNVAELRAVSSATLIPQIPAHTSCASPLLAPFIQAMHGSSYTLVLLASSLSRCHYQCLYQDKLQTLYNTLFPFREITYAHHEHNTHSSTDSNTCAQAHTQTQTQSESDELSSTQNTSHATTQSLTLNYDVPTKIKPTQVSTQNNSQGDTHSTKDTHSGSHSHQDTHTDTCNHSHTHTSLDIQITNYRSQNTKVITILSQIDLLLTRYQQTFNLPLFNSNTYFLSDSAATCLRAAATYINTLEDTTSPLYPSFLNTWLSSNTSFENLLSSLSQLCPPSFCKSPLLRSVTPALPMTSLELGALLTPPLISK